MANAKKTNSTYRTICRTSCARATLTFRQPTRRSTLPSKPIN